MSAAALGAAGAPRGATPLPRDTLQRILAELCSKHGEAQPPELRRRLEAAW
jgi:hypothetical protein